MAGENIPAVRLKRRLHGEERDRATAHDPWDESDPASVISLAPEAVREAMERVPVEWRALPEKDLRIIVQPNEIDERVRLTFWAEYFRALEAGKRMSATGAHAGACNRLTYYRSILTNPDRMAFILSPPVSHDVRAEVALNKAYRRIEEILDLPMTDSAGRPIPSIARLINDIRERLEDRVYGPVVQRVEQKTLQVTGQMSAEQTEKVVQAETQALDSPEELDRKLLELRQKAESLSVPSSLAAADGEVVDAELVEGDQ